jgi:CheY-like chemotaxis protein
MITISNIVKVLVAEDDYSTADLYRRVLKGRGHDVTVVNRGEQCLKKYSEQLSIVRDTSPAHGHASPYDSVILDYKLPDINGLEVAKEILTLNPHQRIIILSAYALEILSRASDWSNIPMEVLEKPISNDVLIDTVEDAPIFDELKKFDLNIDVFKKGGFSHEQLRELADILKSVKGNGVI